MNGNVGFCCFFLRCTQNRDNEMFFLQFLSRYISWEGRKYEMKGGIGGGREGGRGEGRKKGRRESKMGKEGD